MLDRQDVEPEPLAGDRVQRRKAEIAPGLQRRDALDQKSVAVVEGAAPLLVGEHPVGEGLDVEAWSPGPLAALLRRVA